LRIPNQIIGQLVLCVPAAVSRTLRPPACNDGCGMLQHMPFPLDTCETLEQHGNCASNNAAADSKDNFYTCETCACDMHPPHGMTTTASETGLGHGCVHSDFLLDASRHILSTCEAMFDVGSVPDLGAADSEGKT